MAVQVAASCFTTQRTSRFRAFRRWEVSESQRCSQCLESATQRGRQLAGTGAGRRNIPVQGARRPGILKEMELSQEGPNQSFTWTGKEADELSLGRAAESYRKRREGDRSRVGAMIQFARSTRCRLPALAGVFWRKIAAAVPSL